MPITKSQKGQILKNLEEKFSRAKSVYFAENKGLSVKNATLLRSKLHEKGIDMVVAKKTLMKLAAKSQNMPEITDEVLTGPIAAVIGYDEDMIAPSKMVKDFGDTVEQKIVLTGGIMEGRLLSKAEAMELASLPSRLQLLARLVGSMKSPLTGFYMVIKGLSEKSPAAKEETPAAPAETSSASEAKTEAPAAPAAEATPAPAAEAAPEAAPEAKAEPAPEAPAPDQAA